MTPKLQEFFFDHFKAVHETEIQRIDKIRDRVSFVVGFLTLLGGVITYFATIFPHSWHCGRTLFFYIPFLAAVSLFTWACVLVLWVIGGNYLYESFPDNPKMDAYMTHIEKWATDEKADDEHALYAVRKDFLNAYSKCGQHNYKVTASRTGKLGFATKLVVYSFLPVFLMIPSLVYEGSVRPEKPTVVQLIPTPQEAAKNPLNTGGKAMQADAPSKSSDSTKSNDSKPMQQPNDPNAAAPAPATSAPTPATTSSAATPATQGASVDSYEQQAASRPAFPATQMVHEAIAKEDRIKSK